MVMRQTMAGVAGVILLALIGASCARETTGAAVVRASALGALPGESVGLFVIEVRSLRKMAGFSKWMREMATTAEKQGPFKEVRERLKLDDVVNKLERVGLAVVPLPDMGLGYGILVEGSFEEQALRDNIGEEILTFIEVPGEPDLSATVIEGGNLALGPRSVLEMIRRNAASGESGIDRNEAMLDMLESVQSTSQVWGAVDCHSLGDVAREFAGSALFDAAPLPDSSVARALQSLAFQGRFGKDLEFDLFGEADAEENAALLADTLRGLVAFGRMGANQDPGGDWASFLEGVDIDQQGSTITLTGSIPEKTLISLAESVGESASQLPSELIE
jgi:hypothetical protein